MSDLRIDLLEPGFAVRLYEAKNENYTLMGTIPVDENWENVTIHCGVITKGGRYVLQLISNNTDEDDDLIQVPTIVILYNLKYKLTIPFYNISFINT